MRSQGSTALLFDLDGTLAATDHLHFEAFNVMLGAFGRTVDMAYYEAHVLGRTNALIMRDLFPDFGEDEHRRLADEKEAAFRELARRSIAPTLGLGAFLDFAGARGLSCGLVTNAPRLNAEMMLDSLGLAARFDTLVIGDELAAGKPDPLPYATGLARLKASPAHSVAFEDSLAGVRSALGAGLAVIGLTTTLAADVLLGAGASLAIADFTDPRLEPFVEERLSIA